MKPTIRLALASTLLLPSFSLADDTASRVLFYGDSNTWGAIPSVATPGHRYPADQTWPYLLDARLPTEVDVIVEGLGGRTTDFDPNAEDPLRYSGAEMLPSVLATHRPVDVLVIMLGTNDLFAAHNRSVEDTAKGVEHMINLARNVRPPGTNDPTPRILLVSPTAIDEIIYQTPFAPYFEGGVEKSRRFATAYAEVAERLGVKFLDAGAIIQTDTEDGIHFNLDDHQTFAKAIEPVVIDLLAAKDN
jgi:lysophospholipase L1-like esterase